VEYQKASWEQVFISFVVSPPATAEEATRAAENRLRLTLIPTSVWESTASKLQAWIEIAAKVRAADEAKPVPSARAAEMVRQAKQFADAEVKRHLAAGRSVYGRRDGKPVVVNPKK
jgi:hypothetical protein